MSLIPTYGFGAESPGVGESLSPTGGYGAGTGIIAAIVSGAKKFIQVCFNQAVRLRSEL